MARTIQPGSQVTLHYTLTLADGTVVDSTAGGEPVTVRIGQGELVEFLEQRLLGLAPGDRRRFELSAAETCTGAVEDMVQQLPRSDFPAQMELRVGEVIGFRTPDGAEVPGRVLDLRNDAVVVDFSHPLTGRDLSFDVDIVTVNPA